VLDFDLQRFVAAKVSHYPVQLRCRVTVHLRVKVRIGEDQRFGDIAELNIIGEQRNIRFLVFGKGPEATTFAALVNSAGYPILLLSPDTETLQSGESVGCPTHHMTTKRFPKDVSVDQHTAIVLFFHDHDWEPLILHRALETDAFYIGSQGSQRARDARVATLQEMGVSASDIIRLRGPVGLIPSARDAGTLAVSVLAEILATAMQKTR